MGTICKVCLAGTCGRFAVREQMFGTGEQFTFVQCGHCGTLTLDDVPADLSAYYPADYYSFTQQGPSVRPTPRRYLDRAQTAVSLRHPTYYRRRWRRCDLPVWLDVMSELRLGVRARICDVGCGSGALLRILRLHGFCGLVGCDPFVAKEVLEPELRVHRVEFAALQGPFDLVMFNHSLEHMGKPVEALSHARDTLGPRGAVLVRIPVAGSFAWRRFGVHWIALDPPRHLFVPTAAGMSELATRSGLRVHRVIYDSDARQFWGSERVQQGTIVRHATLGGDALHTHSKRELRLFTEQANRLNAKGDGDTAAFVLIRA